MKQMRKKNVNLILSHMNPTFLLIGHSNAFKHTHCTFIIYMKKGSIQGLNLFQFVSNWSLKFWSLNHTYWL
jgi:ABC-type polysaccharide/polyol phosphate transport system ATPase subunit